MMKKNYHTWIEISSEAYRNNIRFFKNRIGENVELSAVVKANAYGHGLPQILELAVQNGISSFSVHSLEEAIRVHSLVPRSQILLMGPLSDEELEYAVIHGFRIPVFDKEMMKSLDSITQKFNQPARLHVKINTGTNRLGLKPSELTQILPYITRNALLVPEGIYTHFANIEDTTDHGFAFAQLGIFTDILNQLKQQGIRPEKIHTACSAAILLFPETHFTMVRLGISQYGFWPSRETFVSYRIQHSKNGENALRPILSWKARIGQILHVAAGECIGYGCTYKVSRDSLIATIPVGYSDGVDRRLSNNGYFLVHGKRAPIRGRVCMNLTMIDVTDIPGVRKGDIVTLIGRDGEEQIQADHWASWMNTISYEVVSRISPHIPRIITE